MTTILHIEDDPALAELVEDSFKAFGFRGTYLVAATVQEAEGVLGDLAKHPRLDLIISDMHLEDGSGLDVVHRIRTHPSRAHIPIVILSGDVASETVNLAYAVGANSYVSKGMRGRNISEIMRALYAHWLTDARLPKPEAGVTGTRELVARAVNVRRRKTAMYMRIAEELGPEDGAFWMDFALREGNLANVLSFLLGQLGSRELPADLLAGLRSMQGAELRSLDELEQRPVRGRADAQRYIRPLVENLDAPAIVRMTAELFPVVPVAMTALRNVMADNLEQAAQWIESHATDPALRAEIPRLYASAAQFRVIGPSHVKVSDEQRRDDRK